MVVQPLKGPLCFPHSAPGFHGSRGPKRIRASQGRNFQYRLLQLLCCRSCSRSPLLPTAQLSEERRREAQEEEGCGGLAWWMEVGMGEDGVWKERIVDGQDAGNLFIHFRF